MGELSHKVWLLKGGRVTFKPFEGHEGNFFMTNCCPIIFNFENQRSNLGGVNRPLEWDLYITQYYYYCKEVTKSFMFNNAKCLVVLQ